MRIAHEDFMRKAHEDFIIFFEIVLWINVLISYCTSNPEVPVLTRIDDLTYFP